MAKIGLIGAGSWGTALSKLAADNGHRVMVWSIVREEIEMLRKNREHLDKLPGVKLPESISYTTELAEAIEGMDLCILAVPSPFTRSTAAMMKPFVKEEQIIVNVAKGVEEKTLMTLSEIIGEETGAEPLLLHSCHNVTRRGFEAGVTYVELMKQNVENLRKGLDE